MQGRTSRAFVKISTKTNVHRNGKAAGPNVTICIVAHTWVIPIPRGLIQWLSPPNFMASQAPAHHERGLRLLSIDGGGIRGLSPLFLLKQILYKMQHAKQLSDLPRPCDVFDLAVGTGTGGLIVIMLFRLQMSVDEAIHAYTTLMENIFSPKNWILGGYEEIPRLNESMVSIISQRSTEDPMLINMVNEDGPKCFVSALLSGDAKGPALFRSWSTADQHHSTIVQAAWATARAPLFFNAVEHNNPVKYVVEEANSLFPGRPISCLLSLGTGTAEVIGLKQPDAFQNVLPQNLIGLLKGTANDCERQSDAMEKQLHREDRPDFYFRLNVDEGLQHVSLAEWNVLNDVSAHTLRYLERLDVERKVDRLVQILKGETERTSSPLPAFRSLAAKEDVDLALPEPSSITVPLHRLPATPTVDDNTGVPSASLSTAVPLYRLPVTSTPESDDVVPSTLPGPLSITVPLYRSPATSTPEGDGFVPSAVPEPSSMTVPLYRSPATSTPEGNGFVPSAVPEPSSITVPLYRSPGASTLVEDEDEFVPSAAPEPSSGTVPLRRLPATAVEPSQAAQEPSSVIVSSIRLPSTDGDDYPRSVALEPSSVPVSLYRPTSTSLEDGHFVPSSASGSSLRTVPSCRSTEITSVGDAGLPESRSVEDGRVPSAGPVLLSTTPALATSDMRYKNMFNWPYRRVQKGDLSAQDIVIVLMGPTGSGKSTFIEKLTGIEGIAGHGFASTTQNVTVYRYTLPEVQNSTITLVDTPGFEDTHRTDYDVFEMISTWLIETYSRQIGLAGLLYFHRISDNRMSGTPLRNLVHFQRLCENELDRVILTSTMWEDMDEATGSRRENELKEHYWRVLIDCGSSMKRFLNTRQSCIDILRPIIQGASSQRNAPRNTVQRISTIKRFLKEYAVAPVERFRGRATTAIADIWRGTPRIFIFVGPYGAGKSQFIDCLTQETKWANHSMSPDHHPIRFVRTDVPNGNGSVILVDTEGFSDVFMTVDDILKEVTEWLIKSFEKNSKATGILFFNNITDNRLVTVKLPSRHRLREVGGADAIRHLIFVTTHWDKVKPQRGQTNEGYVQQHYYPFLQEGARMDRFDKTSATAWRILDRLLA